MLSRAKILLIVGTVLVLGLLTSVSAFHILRDGQNARATAETLLEGNARVIANALDRHLLQADGALASLPVLLGNIAEGKAEITPKVVGDLLRSLTLYTFSVREVMLLSSDGSIWASSSTSPGSRPHFDPAILLAQPRTGSASLVGPVRNSLSGDWSVFVTRSVAIPGGRTMLAAAEISAPELASLVAEVRLDMGGKVFLERPNGEVLLSFPHDENIIGRPAPFPLSLRQQFDRAFELPGAPVETIAVARPLLLGDVVLSLTNETEAALASWQTDRRNDILAGVVAGLLIIMVAATIFVFVGKTERLAAERERASSMLQDAVAGMGDGFVMWDEQDRMVICNEKFRDIYDLARPGIAPGKTYEEIMRFGAQAGQFPLAEGRIEEFVQEAVAWHQKGEGVTERLLPDGRWILNTERRMASGGIVGIRTDITDLKSTQDRLAAETARANEAAAKANEQNRRLRERDLELQMQNARFETALNNMSHGLLMVDHQERVIVANPRFADLFHLDPARLVPGMATAELRAESVRAGAFDPAVLIELARQHTALARSRSAKTFTSADGNGRILAVTQRPMGEGGWIAIYEDVTEQRRSEGRVRFLAHHDDLTKLPNRAHLRGELDERLAALRGGGAAFALFYLDLDRFKDVNDTCGHQVGDALLREVGSRLGASIADGDLVARLGGDEFAIVRGGDMSDDALTQLSAAIIERLSEPYSLLGRNVSIGASVGVVVAQNADGGQEDLLRRADLALYQAKASGRGKWSLFQPALEERRLTRARLERELREAIEAQAFSLVYQPIFDLTRDRVTSFEALIRWHHADRGWISPSEFVPLAEEMGLIDRIGQWALHRACEDIAKFPPHIRVAVNLSAHQLRVDDIVQTVREALAGSGLAPQRLELEITETALLAEHRGSAAIIEALKALGPSIALDDFGTGYSSLSHLRNVPLDKIKIDQSFVREMTSNDQSAAIVTSLVELAAKLGKSTTAEGIETEAHLAAVRAAGCTHAQGYLLGKPRSILHAFDALSHSSARPGPKRRRAMGHGHG